MVEYFRAHINVVQSLMGEEVDDIDRQHQRLRSMGKISVRQAIHKTTWKARDRVLAAFSEWEKRGYGTIQHPRKNQTVFAFGEK